MHTNDDTRIDRCLSAVRGAAGAGSAVAALFFTFFVVGSSCEYIQSPVLSRLTNSSRLSRVMASNSNFCANTSSRAALNSRDGIFASGRPVIVTAEKNTALFEVIKDSGGGIAVSPEDVAGLVFAISDLAKSPERRKQMGNSARDYAIKFLDINLILGNFEQSLKSL